MLNSGDDALLLVSDSSPTIVDRSEALQLLKLRCMNLAVCRLIEEEALNLWPNVIGLETVRGVCIQVTIDQTDSNVVPQGLNPAGDPLQRQRIPIEGA